MSGYGVGVKLAHAINHAQDTRQPRGKTMAPTKDYYEIKNKVGELDKTLNSPDTGICTRIMELEKKIEHMAADMTWIKWISTALLGVVIAIAFKVFTS